MLNPEADKLNKTATGIKTMLNQATGPVKDNQESIEEGIIEPMVNKWLKMAAYLMGENETKYVFITGQSPKWVKVTKGLLSGKIKLADLIEAELLSEEINPETGQSEIDEVLQMLIESGKNPEEELLFDADWVIKVETGSMAEVDAEQATASLERWAIFRKDYQVPTDFKKVSDEMAARIGLKDVEQYDLAPQMGQMGGMPGQGVPQPMIGSTPINLPGSMPGQPII
jgi:hypothetical protein